MKAQQNANEEHLLLRKDVVYLKNWKEWKVRWEKEHRVEFLHSLLHFGFNIPVEDLNEVGDRLHLYLEIADNNEYSTVFSRGEEEGVQYYAYFEGCTTFTKKAIRGKAEFRQMLSRKAFEVLCQKFFKDTSENYDLPSWLRGILAPGVLEKILWFFRGKERGNLVNINYFADHHMKTAIEFADELCFFVWDAVNYRENAFRPKLGRENIEMLRSFLPQIIETLNNLGSIDFLLKKDRYEYVSEDHLTLLKELALKEELPFPSISVNSRYGTEFRKPKDIDEAVYGRSQAAKVLLLLRVLRKEKNRFEEIQEMETKLREATEELEKLGGKE